MFIKKYKPITPGRRHMSTLCYSKLLTKNSKPLKSLLIMNKKHAGRNNRGLITVRHKGGGHKKKYRIIDNKRNKDNIQGIISTIEYDPNRNTFICLVNYIDGEKRYIIAPKNIKVGMKIISGDKVDIIIGNNMKLKHIIEGTFVHNIELRPGKGGQIARAAGCFAQILGKDESNKYTILRLVSGEVRKILSECRATIGIVGNEDHMLIHWGKAGRNRWRGIRPTVRGSAMNPNDHPHGGGEGKSPIGRKAPVTPWGKKALGLKTRNNKKFSTKLIIRKYNQ